MNKRVRIYTVFLAVPFLMAMGVMGKPPALDRAPEPSEKLEALIVDLDGLSTRITSVSYMGELYLPAYRGKALITIPFQKIATIDFGPKEKSRRRATVHFRGQPAEEFSVDENILFVGSLPIGTYQIQVKDMTSIAFMTPEPETAKAPSGRKKGSPEE